MNISISPSLRAGSKPWMDHGAWIESIPATPAFVYDEERLAQNLEVVKRIRSAGGSRVLYSIKAFPFTGLLKRIQGEVDGFSVSSLFEARLAHEVLDARRSLHITTPGFVPREIPEIGRLCDHVSFNSLNQLERLAPLLGDKASTGLRINPQLSFLDDPRYDPCRPHSKLGVPLNQVAQSYRAGGVATRISGLHFHTHFGSTSYAPLQASIRHIETQLPQLVRKLEWVNLGGGYLFREAGDLQALLALIEHINSDWGAQVYFEPGKAIVDNTGFLVASVIDRFESDGKQVAVLDTSVNHLPEVFEYQTSPKLLGERSDGCHKATLAGCTCLSGDLFGEFRFARPLEIDDRVVFESVGAYSLIKASRFNGYNLPSIYFIDRQGEPTRLKHYDYDDYRRQWSESSPLDRHRDPVRADPD